MSVVAIKENGRIEILSSIDSHYGEPLIVVIELNSTLGKDFKANINKMITMYPKRELDKYIKKFDVNKILYLNKGNLRENKNLDHEV